MAIDHGPWLHRGVNPGPAKWWPCARMNNASAMVQMFVSPPPLQIICRKPNAQGDGIRKWGLWELICHEGGVLMWDECPEKRPPRASLCLPPHEDAATSDLPRVGTRREDSHRLPGGGSRQTLNLLALCSWTSQSPEQ